MTDTIGQAAAGNTDQDKNKKNEHLLSTIGLCARAGRLVIGTPMVCEALRKAGAVAGVLEASDTSDNTHKKLSDKCGFYHTPLYRVSAEGAALGHAVGKTGIVAAVAVTDKSLMQAIEKYL